MSRRDRIASGKKRRRRVPYHTDAIASRERPYPTLPYAPPYLTPYPAGLTIRRDPAFAFARGTALAPRRLSPRRAPSRPARRGRRRLSASAPAPTLFGFRPRAFSPGAPPRRRDARGPPPPPPPSPSPPPKRRASGPRPRLPRLPRRRRPRPFFSSSPRRRRRRRGLPPPLEVRPGEASVEPREVALLGDVVRRLGGVSRGVLADPLRVRLELRPVRRGDELFLIRVEVVLALALPQQAPLAHHRRLAIALLLLRRQRLDVAGLAVDALRVRGRELRAPVREVRVDVAVVVEHRRVLRQSRRADSLRLDEEEARGGESGIPRRGGRGWGRGVGERGERRGGRAIRRGTKDPRARAPVGPASPRPAGGAPPRSRAPSPPRRRRRCRRRPRTPRWGRRGASPWPSSSPRGSGRTSASSSRTCPRG